MTDSISTYRHDCDFCDETITGDTLDEVKTDGRTHLEDQHYSEFEQVFVDQISGKSCLGGCGYRFPRTAENDIGFECSNCGADNFPEFADRHIWWNVELE